MRRRVVLKVFGVVQGVFYRDFIAQHTSSLNLNGSVENQNDGTVKVIIEGEEDDLHKLIELAMQGPRGSHIEDVQAEWLAATGEFKRFEIR